MGKAETLKEDENYQLKIEAALLMKKAMEVIRDYRFQHRMKINPLDDPNQTGLIGERFTDITGSIVDLSLKRTATNPDFAAVLVDMFLRAGLKTGDTIAVGSSGSFPPLVIATMAAIKVMGLRPIIITGIASSTWGATEPDLSILDMERILYEKGIFPFRSIAVSMGGELDRGTKYFGHEKETFLEIVERSGLPLIYEETFLQSVEKRLELYDRYANGEKIKLFVNVGGASANIGICLDASRIPNGLTQRLSPPETCPHAEKGVIFRMAEKEIPIIHLLNVKWFAAKYGLPIDSIPLPEIGKGAVYRKMFSEAFSFF